MNFTIRSNIARNKNEKEGLEPSISLVDCFRTPGVALYKMSWKFVHNFLSYSAADIHTHIHKDRNRTHYVLASLLSWQIRREYNCIYTNTTFLERWLAATYLLLSRLAVGITLRFKDRNKYDIHIERTTNPGMQFSINIVLLSAVIVVNISIPCIKYDIEIQCLYCPKSVRGAVNNGSLVTLIPNPSYACLWCAAVRSVSRRSQQNGSSLRSINVNTVQTTVARNRILETYSTCNLWPVCGHDPAPRRCQRPTTPTTWPHTPRPQLMSAT